MLLGITLTAFISIAAVISMLSVSDKAKFVPIVESLLADLEVYRRVNCGALPSTVNTATLLSGGFIAQNQAIDFFAWQGEFDTNNTASLVITSNETGIQQMAKAYFRASDHATLPNAVQIPVPYGPQMTIPDLHINVENELGVASVGCI